jgi:branched-chain amino acid transport system ATP-binding protein
MTALLQVEGLTRSFGGLVAVRDISFGVDVGEILGLIGPNGSGKTTTLNLIAGVQRAQAGTIRFAGEEVGTLKEFRRVRRGINRTFQLVRLLPGMTVRDNVMAGAMFGARPEKPSAARATADGVLAELDLASKADFVADQLTYVDQKRVELARALATRPRVLLLDEWLSGLDAAELEASMAVVRGLAAARLAIILVEHVMTAVRGLCGRVVVMSAGVKIAEGPPDMVLRDPDVVRAYLGDEDAGD